MKAEVAYLHQLISLEFAGLLQGDKADLVGWEGLIREGPLRVSHGKGLQEAHTMRNELLKSKEHCAKCGTDCIGTHCDQNSRLLSMSKSSGCHGLRQHVFKVGKLVSIALALWHIERMHQISCIHPLIIFISNQACKDVRPHLNRAQIVGSNGHQGSLTAQVLVQLVLKVNEALVAGSIKCHAPQHRTNHKGTDLCM